MRTRHLIIILAVALCVLQLGVAITRGTWLRLWLFAALFLAIVVATAFDLRAYRRGRDYRRPGRD